MNEPARILLDRGLPQIATVSLASSESVAGH